MRAGFLAVATAVILFSPGAGSAQVLSITFHDGRVQLTAENVPISRILAEWTRVGGTRIVNGERVPGGPVSLLLENTPEQQAIDVILRGAAGYMVSARETAPPDGSVFDKILVLPTSSRAPSTPATLTPPPPPPIEAQEPEIDGPEQAAPRPGLPAGFPRARVPVNDAAAGARPQEGEDTEQNGPAPTPGNPFGVPAGSTRPGTIAPVVPPRNPNNPQPR